MQDGALSDNELNHFQVHCFSAPLQPEELSGVKRVVADQMEKVIPLAITLVPQPLVPLASAKSSLVRFEWCSKFISFFLFALHAIRICCLPLRIVKGTFLI